MISKMTLPRQLLAFSALLVFGQVTQATTLPVLNDTGVTHKQCYQANSDALIDCNSAGAQALNNKQDGMLGRDASVLTNGNKDGVSGFRFTKIDNTGAALPVTASTWSCVKDNMTGFIWENKTNDFALHDGFNTFTHYSTADGANFLGSATDTSGFVAAVNQEALCGASDWRLPAAQELQSIVNYGVAYPGPVIDTVFFPNTQPSSYWAAEPFMGTYKHGWVVTFDIGFVDDSNRKWSAAVRLVRDTKHIIKHRYTVSADGQEVKDNTTQLIWRRCPEGMMWSATTCLGTASVMSHEQALQLASSQASSTGVAWRLPNVKELSSIADRTGFKPAIDKKTFPKTPSENFWSSSPNVAHPSSAWYVAFDDADSNDDLRTNTFAVRLVRDSQ